MNEAFKIEGTVHKILDLQTGTGSKGNWARQSFIIKTKGSYPKELCITAWGDKCDTIPTTTGKDCTVFVNPSSREHNGRWNTELVLWKIEY